MISHDKWIDHSFASRSIDSASALSGRPIDDLSELPSTALIIRFIYLDAIPRRNGDAELSSSPDAIVCARCSRVNAMK